MDSMNTNSNLEELITSLFGKFQVRISEQLQDIRNEIEYVNESIVELREEIDIKISNSDDATSSAIRTMGLELEYSDKIMSNKFVDVLNEFVSLDQKLNYMEDRLQNEISENQLMVKMLLKVAVDFSDNNSSEGSSDSEEEKEYNYCDEKEDDNSRIIIEEVAVCILPKCGGTESNLPKKGGEPIRIEIDDVKDIPKSDCYVESPIIVNISSIKLKENLPVDIPEQLLVDIRNSNNSIVDISEQLAVDIPEQLAVNIPEQLLVDIPEQLVVDIPEQLVVDIPEQLLIDIRNSNNSLADIREQSSVDISEQSPVNIPEQLAVNIPEQLAVNIPEQLAVDIPEQLLIDIRNSNNSLADIPEQSPVDIHYIPDIEIFTRGKVIYNINELGIFVKISVDNEIIIEEYIVDISGYKHLEEINNVNVKLLRHQVFNSVLYIVYDIYFILSDKILTETFTINLESQNKLTEELIEEPTINKEAEYYNIQMFSESESESDKEEPQPVEYIIEPIQEPIQEPIHEESEEEEEEEYYSCSNYNLQEPELAMFSESDEESTNEFYEESMNGYYERDIMTEQYDNYFDNFNDNYETEDEQIDTPVNDNLFDPASEDYIVPVMDFVEDYIVPAMDFVEYIPVIESVPVVEDIPVMGFGRYLPTPTPEPISKTKSKSKSKTKSKPKSKTKTKTNSIKCECGGSYTKKNRSNHLKTKKHIKYSAI